MAEVGDKVEVTLNGLQVTLDRKTGSVLRMAYPGPGTLLETTPDQAGMVDLAYPLPQFEPLRLASRYSEGAKITRTDGGVTIAWEGLGASRPFPPAGKVSAEVRWREAPDGRSVIVTCAVTNQSDRAVRQVVFPDFIGLVAVAGPDITIFKTGGFGSAPFRELRVPDGDQFYAQRSNVVEYGMGSMFQAAWMRWIDLGSLNGGFSLFPRRWGWDPQIRLVLHLSEVTQKLRLMCLHPVDVAPGTRWESGELWLTPHTSGWAKGIEPYREWVRQNLKREHPLPKHVREGLGFRTLWMCQNQPNDPQDAVWKFGDLPEAARESKEHGLDEMVLWSAHPGFELPLPPPYPHLGTEAELAKAVAECKRVGVNVAPFISVLQANKKTGPRYGLQVPETGGWTYHLEMLPRFNPPYAGAYACAQVDVNHKLWREEVLASCKHLADLGIPSISWDQYYNPSADSNIHELTAQIRRVAKAKDPESTFSAEELNTIELDAGYLDYTWNWGGYVDCQAYTNVYPAPRRNININRSPWEVRRAFLDNLYMNLFPAKPEGINGSAHISDYPEVSRALKECAKLRRQFLPYFTEGTLIGNCLLTEWCHGAVVQSYVRPDRVLLLVMNEGAERAVTLKYDLAPWVKPGLRAFTLKAHDLSGKLLKTSRIARADGELTTEKLTNQEIAAYEFVAE